MTEVRVAADTHIGKVRRRNEDAYGFTGIGAVQSDSSKNHGTATELPFLAVVADGLGGHPDGDAASRRVVDTLLQASPTDAITLAAAVESAHQRLMAGHEGPRAAGPGSTVAAVLIAKDEIILANVGDSRVYLVEPDGPMTQLTVDDAPRPVAPGAPTRGLTQCLGPATAHAEITPDVRTLPATAPMRFLLCTDGLSSYTASTDISDRLRVGDAATACQQLVDLSLTVGGADNVTVVVLDVCDGRSGVATL